MQVPSRTRIIVPMPVVKCFGVPVVILPRIAQVVGELDAVLVRVFIRIGVAERFAFPVPDGLLGNRIDNAAGRIEVVCVDVVQLRAGKTAVDRLQGGNRRVAEPDCFLGNGLRAGVAVFAEQAAGLVVDELDGFAPIGLDR